MGPHYLYAALEFLDLCEETCLSGDADGDNGPCGGFVIYYTDDSRTHASMCIFKVADNTPVSWGSDSRSKRDHHQLVDADIWDMDEEAFGYD